MIRHSISIFGLRILGGLLTLGFQALVTRSLEPDTAGIFFFLVSSLFILHLATLSGLDTEGMRVSSPFFKAGRKAEFLQITLKGARLIALNGVLLLPLIGLLAYFFKSSLALSNDTLLIGLLPFLGILILFTLHAFLVAMMRSAGSVTASSLALTFLPGFLSLLFLGASLLLLAEVTLTTVILSWIAAYIVTLCFSALWLRNTLRTNETEQEATPSHKALLRAGAPVMAIQLLSQIPWQGSIWYAGLTMDLTSIAILAICLRVAEVIAMPGLIIGFLGQPYLARQLPRKENNAVSTVLRALSTLVAAPTFVGVLLLIVAGGPLLGWVFGAKYAVGGSAAALIAAGRWFEASIGNGAYSALIMASYRRLTFKITGISTLLFFLILATTYSWNGLLSLSLAIFFYYTSRSLFLAFAAWRHLHVKAWPSLSLTTIREGAHLLEQDQNGKP